MCSLHFGAERREQKAALTTGDNEETKSEALCKVSAGRVLEGLLGGRQRRERRGLVNGLHLTKTLKVT